jgi:hypothetical protein
MLPLKMICFSHGSSNRQAQEYENRFWTIFGMLLSTALFFANDSPVAFGRHWSPTLGFIMVILSGYVMHIVSDVESVCSTLYIGCALPSNIRISVLVVGSAPSSNPNQSVSGNHVGAFLVME